MRVPVLIPLTGRKVRIEYEDYVYDDDGKTVLRGEACLDTETVRISTQVHESAEAVFRTLFHELIHMVLGFSGHQEMLPNEQDEAITYALEHALGPILSLKRVPGSRYKDVTFPWEE